MVQGGKRGGMAHGEMAPRRGIVAEGSFGQSGKSNKWRSEGERGRVRTEQKRKGKGNEIRKENGIEKWMFAPLHRCQRREEDRGGTARGRIRDRPTRPPSSPFSLSPFTPSCRVLCFLLWPVIGESFFLSSYILSWAVCHFFFFGKTVFGFVIVFALSTSSNHAASSVALPRSAPPRPALPSSALTCSICRPM